jgi:hypothetical protein
MAVWMGLISTVNNGCMDGVGLWNIFCGYLVGGFVSG